MNPEITAAYETELQDCQQLARCYQEEREFYLTHESVSEAEMLALQKRKVQLVSRLDAHRNWLPLLAPRPGATDTLKAPLRKLAGLLEQLLVIDRENELLLRQRLQRTSTSGAGLGQALRQAPTRAAIPAGPAAPTAPAPVANRVTPMIFPRLQPAQLQASYGLFKGRRPGQSTVHPAVSVR